MEGRETLGSSTAPFDAATEPTGVAPKTSGTLWKPFGEYPDGDGADAVVPAMFCALPALDVRVLENGFFTGPVSAAPLLSTGRGPRL
jgi:hypothetical protein